MKARQGYSRGVVPLLVTLFMVSSCARAETTTSSEAVPTATTSTPEVSTTTSSVPPTQASTTTTTTTTTAPQPSTTSSLPAPREPWLVEGRDYYFPVQPPGDASYGAEHHDYPATDIFAPLGATLVAVTGGTIDEVGTIDEWDPAVDDPATRSGLYVSIIGADGVRYYYSHLSRVEPGIEAATTVYAGQLIGAVGTSGNARQTPPHVHFGISHPTFPGDWETRRGEVSPYPYLIAWEEGDQLIPALG